MYLDVINTTTTKRREGNRTYGIVIYHLKW